MAPDAQKWGEALRKTHHNECDRYRCSLHELFASFAEDRLEDLGRRLGPMDLRLLLHPLHSIVSNYRQITASIHARPRTHTSSAYGVRPWLSQTFEEIHGLMQRWLVVFENLDDHGARQAAVAQASLIQYHLICINLFTCFKTLESYSRNKCPDFLEGLATTSQEGLSLDNPELLLHCGQVLRLIRAIEQPLRPIWWSAAIYRATIVLWVCSVSRKHAPRPIGRQSLDSIPLVPLDTLPFYDPNLSHYLRYKIGRPYLTTKDGVIVHLDDPRAVLSTCMEPLEGHGQRMTRLTKGLYLKLQALSRNQKSA